MTDVDAAITDWMLDSDPALRWQVERDVAGAPDAVWQGTRDRVATEGFGAKLRALQDPNGQWAGGSYFPADFDWHGPEAAEGAGQPYTATTWSLNALREWGIDPSVLGDTAELLAANSRWDYNDGPYWEGEVDCCINAFTLANGAWLGADVSLLPPWFLDHRMPDGGWNCEWENGSQRSSFHSTLNSLRGILYWETATSDTSLRAARHSAEQYLLERGLLYRLTTGELPGPWVTALAYPFRWVYSVLGALDYFRSASLHDGTAPDPRMGEAIEVVRSARQSADAAHPGAWLQERRHPGRVWFDVDAPVGEPSKWLTFYATRVLEWWDVAQQSPS